MENDNLRARDYFSWPDIYTTLRLIYWMWVFENFSEPIPTLTEGRIAVLP
jgi:hypothetical protein